MDVSSGDESDEPATVTTTASTSTSATNASRSGQLTLEEKRRIEENIQALVREFERKRLEEKLRKVASIVPTPSVQQETVAPADDKSITTSISEPSIAEDSQSGPAGDSQSGPAGDSQSGPAGDSRSGQSSSINDADVDDAPFSRLGPSPATHVSTDECADPTAVAFTVTDESETKHTGGDDGTCELPSSSVEVPPVPAYEEIDQCIYRVESKKKAVSLMCFCRGNNMDCSDGRCDNRAMLTECPKNCLGKDKDCKNRRFAKREYAAVQAFYTGPNKGFGVQAVAPIKKGQFIIEYVGEVVSSEEFAKRLKRYGRDPSHMHHYMFEIGSMIIDATKKGNCSRFMNHSCEPNAVCEKWYVPKTPCAIDRIGFFAKRDIELGEEITFDYQFENYGREAQRCYCGTPSCSGWIGKPPEMIDDDVPDDESEYESDDSERSADEDVKTIERVVPRRKKAHRFRGRDNLTLVEIEEELEKALAIGCRNRTHVLGWIKLMTEITLIKNEPGVLRSMHRIADSVCSIEPTLQHIFVANGLPNIFKMWLRACFPDHLFGEVLDLKLVIIRSLTMMQSCADAINARAPEILPMVSDLASLAITDSIYVKDALDFIIDKLCEEEEPNKQDCPRIPLEVRIDRLTRAAIRLQAVLQQHVKFRIPKKKTDGVSVGQEADSLSSGDHATLSSRIGQGRFSNFRTRRNGGRFSPVDRFNAVVSQGRSIPRFRISRWSNGVLFQTFMTAHQLWVFTC
ncbi:hypothetical protein Y032_0454g1745 [Ancylostoma ceylanicum]|uniref:SET domain protein n=1 Tax=Ancylostoma ceylanicum TaxID=53326 RepID=A0A016WZJ6_9BILA|nr:hypothetical protein Y032_0454g1745 [Ancylostoma ceylanicum]